MGQGNAEGVTRLIVVTGATGRQGGAVSRRLLGEGWAVRAVTRKPASDKAARLREAGAEIVQADMADPASLARAFQGAYGVYNVQNPMVSGHDMEVVQGKNVADAASGAGVQHLVYGSAGPGTGGTGVLQWDAKVEIGEHMRGLGLPLTVLRPMAFMELMTDKGFYPSVSTWHVMPKLLGWDYPVPWVCVEDLAVIAVAAFTRPTEFIGRDVEVAADLRSLAECRSLWREATGRAPRGFPMPVPIFERFVGTDLPRMWRWLRTNRPEFDLQASRKIHPGMRTVRDWIAEGREPQRVRRS